MAANRDRDAGGRYAAGDDRKPANDSRKPMIDSLQRLFAQAERDKDYSGASTLAKTIAALGGADAPEEAAPGSSAENDLIFASFTLREREDWRRLLFQIQAMKNAVLERLGRPVTRKAPLDRPMPMYQFCPHCEGFAKFWSAPDEATGAFLIEHFGEDAMREAVLRFESREAAQ